jgi:hypothetical protein
VTALPVALPEASNEATIASTAPPVEVAPPARLPTDNRVRIETDPAIRISESAPAAVVVLRRSGSKAVPVTVKWRLQDGSGRDVEDFTTPAKRSTRIAAGQTTRAIYLPLVNDDRPESEEFFTLILQSPAGSIGKSNRVTITILDDD